MTDHHERRNLKFLPPAVFKTKRKRDQFNSSDRFGVVSYFSNVNNGRGPESGAKFEDDSTAGTAAVDSSGRVSDDVALPLVAFAPVLQFIYHSVSVDLLDGRFLLARFLLLDYYQCNNF